VKSVSGDGVKKVPAKVRPAATRNALNELYNRPGFLLRRANQICVSIFLEEAADLGITTTQFGAMMVLSSRNDLDQIGLAKLLGIDRSTAALVVGKLEKSGYLARGRDSADLRRHVLLLTREGHDLLDALVVPAERARRREMAAFTEIEAQTFVLLLKKFVDTFNTQIRTPIHPVED
jgi:MarR family transcriptional regulator, lower aerobic nicotinate degradation pathway regulator